MSEQSYLIEFIRIGAQVKVTACDPDTGMEVSIMGPASSPPAALSQLAVQKLRYRLNKKQ